jgi:hypothetical protein
MVNINLAYQHLLCAQVVVTFSPTIMANNPKQQADLLRQVLDCVMHQLKAYK